MPELQNVSLSSPSLTGFNQSFATQVSNLSTLSALLSLKGGSDLNPALQALDETERSQQITLQNALSLYEDEPTAEHGQRLMQVLLQEQARLIAQKEEAQRKQEIHQAQAELTHQQTASYSLSNFWHWVSHSVQDFFGSSSVALAEHHANIAKQREQQLGQLNTGIALLKQELEHFESSASEIEPVLFQGHSSSNEIPAIELQETEVIERERPQQKDTTAQFSSPTSRHLLQQSTGLRIVQPVPDQLIPTGKPYAYSLSDVFASDSPFVLGVTQTRQSALPSWLSFEPMLLSTYPAGSGFAQGITVSGSTVFVANSLAGLQVLDASNLRNLTLLSTYPAGYLGKAYGVAVSGSTVFVADYIVGLQVLDASNLRNLTLLSTYYPGGYTYGVTVSGSTVFVAGNGLQVLDASNPRDLTLLSSYPAYGYGVTVSDSTVFVTDYIGLQVLDASNPRNLTLLSTYPAGWSEILRCRLSGARSLSRIIMLFSKLLVSKF